MEYEPDERRPLLRAISEDGVFDPPQSPVVYEVSRRKRRAACCVILLTEMLERVTFYGITSNFILFLIQEPFSWSAVKALHLYLGLQAMSYILSVFGGLVADMLLGRFKTIVLSLLIYIVGAAFFLLMGYASNDVDFCNELCGSNLTEIHTNLTSVDSEGRMSYQEIVKVEKDDVPTVHCMWPLLIAMCCTAVGAGSVRANMSPFGADQVKHDGLEVIRTFFNWFYWSINIGVLIALVVVSYVQQNINFFYGYVIVVSSLVLALLVFGSGRCTFLMREPVGSVLPNMFKIIGEAFRRRDQRREACQKRGRTDHMLQPCPPPTFLDMAKKRFGGSFPDSMVEDVKSLRKVIGIFILLIPYWIVYYQMQSTFALQAMHMRFTFPDGDNDDTTEAFMFPIAWLTIFDVVVVILLLPVLDQCVYPWLVGRGRAITLYHRLLLGMAFSVLSMVAAGILEVERKHCFLYVPHCAFNQTIRQGSGTTEFNSADLWVFCQVPQYVLIGISEVMASVAALEFAYSHAPKSMQGLIMGLYCLSSGVGCLCGNLLLLLFSIPSLQFFTSIDHGNINNGNLAYFFFMLGGIELIAMIIFSLLNVRKFLNSPGSVQTGHGSGYSSGRHAHVQRRSSASASSSGE